MAPKINLNARIISGSTGDAEAARWFRLGADKGPTHPAFIPFALITAVASGVRRKSIKALAACACLLSAATAEVNTKSLAQHFLPLTQNSIKQSLSSLFTLGGAVRRTYNHKKDHVLRSASYFLLLANALTFASFEPVVDTGIETNVCTRSAATGIPRTDTTWKDERSVSLT